MHQTIRRYPLIALIYDVVKVQSVVLHLRHHLKLGPDLVTVAHGLAYR